MRIKRWQKILLAVGVLVVAAFVGLRVYRGPSGATSAYGGDLEARLLPEFPKAGAESWVNGAPQSLAALRGSVVLVEAWHPD
jgi:hypothetical protein